MLYQKVGTIFIESVIDVRSFDMRSSTRQVVHFRITSYVSQSVKVGLGAQYLQGRVHLERV